MSQSRLIFKNTVAHTIANLTTRFSNILIVLFMARIFHASGVGIYSTAIAYFALIDVATNMGATTYLIREIAKSPTRTNYFVVHFSIMGGMFAALVVGLVWLILPFLGYSYELTISMYIIVLAAVPGTLNAAQYSAFIAHQKVKFVTYTSFACAVLNTGVSLYLMIQGYSVISLMVVFVIIQYLMMFIYFYFINRYITSLFWEFEFSSALQIIREIKVFAALSILGALFAQPEIIILSLLVSETEVGYYSAALKVVGLWYFIPEIFMTNVYPVLSNSYHSSDYKFQIIQDKSVKYLLALSLPLAVGIMVTANPIINLLYGPGFEPAVLLLRILAWTIPIAYISTILWRVLAARNQQHLDLFVRIITLFTRIGGGFLATALWASVGASISAVTNLLLSTYLLAAYVKDHSSTFNFLRLGWRFGFAALGMGVTIWILNEHVQLWGVVLLGGVTYVLLILLFRAFSSDDWNLFRNILRPKVFERNL